MQDNDVLNLLGQEYEILKRLAAKDGRTELEELRFLIRARASGRYVDHGDYPISPVIHPDEIPQVLRVQGMKLEIDGKLRKSGGIDPLTHPPSKPVLPDL